MRLCLEVKNQRGRPLRLIALFLRAWFPAETLKSPERCGFLASSRGDLYRTYALQVEGKFESVVREELCKEIEKKRTCGAYHEALLDLAVNDYTAVIDMPEAPVDQCAKALLNRGVVYWCMERFELAANDFSALAENERAPLHLRQEAMFALPESMIPIRSWSDAMAALIRAFDEGDATADCFGGTPHDLLRVVLRKGHVEWATCSEDLMRIYSTYGVCDKLCDGLTRSIADLDMGDYSETQLDAWNEAWQRAGHGEEACEIALRSLDCAVQAIKAKSDRPLFKLPLEIRELILPLLPKTCGKKEG
jgi:hypothetical protein